MKNILSIATLAAFALMFQRPSSMAQGTFVNLDFESANVPLIPSGQFGSDVTVAQGLPGWTVYQNNTPGGPDSLIRHNNVSLGSASISIFGPQWDSTQILQGKYTVLLGADYNPTGNPSRTNSAAIAQTGQIPQNAKSLVFLSDPANSLLATFAGQQISLFQLGATNNYVILAGDISAFAGLTGELRLTAPFIPGDTGSGGLLDGIKFSTSVVPEPSVFGLFALGCLLLGWRLQKRQ